MPKFKIQNFILFLICPITLFAQQQGFEIAGHLDGLKDGEAVVLTINEDGDNWIPIDSCKVYNNGDFCFKGFVQAGPRMVAIDFANHRAFNSKLMHDLGGSVCDFFLNNGEKVSIKGGDINKMNDEWFGDDVEIEGSPSNIGRRTLMPLVVGWMRSHRLLQHRINKLVDSIGFDKDLVQGLLEGKSILDFELEDIIEDGHNSYYKAAIPLALHELDDFLSTESHYHAGFIADVYNQLDSNCHRSYYGQWLAKYARLCIGQPFPEFNLPQPDGKVISLKDLVARGKMTIVHFWGTDSWERDKYQKELMTYYNKYHDKGLNVVAISADTSADDWTFMVHQKKYPWINVSDLKGWGKGSIVNDVYREGGHRIPNTTNVLLDHDGKIIAWDPQGVELQWYLWKNLGE